MKTSIFPLLCIFIITAIFSCNSLEQPDGGPCTYDKKNYPATIIGIEKKDSINAEVYFRVHDLNGNVFRDSVLWSMEKKEWMPLAKIEKDSISIGKKYKYTVDRIKTGSCNPQIEMLVLQKYSINDQQ